MIVAIHGVPTSPRLWENLPFSVVAPALRGVGTDEYREDWSLESFVEEILPWIEEDTVLVGHDLGGVIAAMATLHRKPKRLVLSGTALGPYWAAVRLTALPGLQRYFYARHGGRHFVAGAVSASFRTKALSTFPGMDPEKMRKIAKAMRPPARLAQQIPVPWVLLWGQQDRWYPPSVARAVARGTGAPLHFVRGGHFCMWEAPEDFGKALFR